MDQQLSCTPRVGTDMAFQTHLQSIPECLRLSIFRTFLANTFTTSPLSSASYEENTNSLTITISASCSKTADDMVEAVHSYMKHIRWFQHNWCLPKTVRLSVDAFVRYEETVYVRPLQWLRFLCKEFRKHEIHVTLAVPNFVHVNFNSREPMWREYMHNIRNIAARWTIEADTIAGFHRNTVIM